MGTRTMSCCLALATLTACLGPQVVPTQRAEGFSLPSLRAHRVAVWPIPTARLDASATQTVAGEYGTIARFLDALGDRFSEQVGAACRQKSLQSREVATILARDESTRPLLDPGRTLGTSDPGDRFAAPPGPDLAPLADLPDLAGIRYALLVRDLEVGREVQAGSRSTYVTDPKGGGTWTHGDAGGATTRARLRIAVLDLPSRKVVWDGAVYSGASSLLFRGTALHEVEEGLIRNFLKEMGVAGPTGGQPPR